MESREETRQKTTQKAQEKNQRTKRSLERARRKKTRSKARKTNGQKRPRTYRFPRKVGKNRKSSRLTSTSKNWETKRKPTFSASKWQSCPLRWSHFLTARRWAEPTKQSLSTVWWSVTKMENFRWTWKLLSCPCCSPTILIFQVPTKPRDTPRVWWWPSLVGT